MERQRKKRGAIRRATTKLLKKIEKDLQEQPGNSDQLEEHLADLRRKESELIRLDEEIEKAIDSESWETEFEEVEEYQERITLWKTRLERQLRKVLSDTASVNTESSTTGKPSNGFQNIKLPRLSIDKFFGDPSNWSGFWAQFTSAIHENDQLTAIDKFIYLKSLLGGVASNAVAGLTISEANYATAIKILTERFGRRDLVISAHMSKLLSLNPVRKSSDITALRILYDSCEIQVRSLENLGVVSENYSALLCPILMKIIPEDILLEFNRRKGQDADWPVTELLSLLRLEIESRERTQQLCKPLEPDLTNRRAQETDKATQPQIKDARPREPSAAALTANAEKNCIYCENLDHATDDCKKHSVKERKEIILKTGRCFVCLQRSHMARMCKLRVRCSNCSRWHHRTLCLETYEGTSSSENNVVANLSHDDQPNVIYLQTAQVIARGDSKKMTVRCLIDSGCQRTFVRESLSKDLKLETVGHETLKIHAFGSEKATTVTRNRVRLILQNTNEPRKLISIEAVETPEVSGGVMQFPSREICEATKELGLELADDTSEEPSKTPCITIVIGADYYWDIVTGKTKRLSGPLVAVETMFGWTLHGPTTVSGMSDCESTPVMLATAQSSPATAKVHEYQRNKWQEFGKPPKEKRQIDYRLAKKFKKNYVSRRLESRQEFKRKPQKKRKPEHERERQHLSGGTVASTNELVSCCICNPLRDSENFQTDLHRRNRNNQDYDPGGIFR